MFGLFFLNIIYTIVFSTIRSVYTKLFLKLFYQLKCWNVIFEILELDLVLKNFKNWLNLRIVNFWSWFVH